MRKLIIIFSILIACNVNAIVWTTLDRPGYESTALYDISGDIIVGINSLSGAIYSGSAWTTLSYPGTNVTKLYGIDGSNVVGRYNDWAAGKYHGFIYNLDSQSWTIHDFPEATDTTIYGVDGSRLVGNYYSQNAGNRTFFYNGTDWITLDHPEPARTQLYDISGDYIVGKNGNFGVIYNIATQTWTDIRCPFSIYEAYMHGIDGSNIVGYGTGHGFLYNMDTQAWTQLDFPNAASTKIYGIDGLNIVGQYIDSLGVEHGFIATIPEPMTVLLFGIGGLILRRKR